MSLDPSIAMGIKPIQFENPMNSLAQFMQLQGAQNQNRLADLQLQQHQQGVDEAKSMNALYAGAVGPDGQIDRAKLFQGAASGGLGSKIPGLQKQFAETDEKAVKVDSEKFKLASDRVKGYKSDLGALYQDPTLTKDKAVARMQSRLQQGLISQEMYQHIVSDLPDDPVALREQLGQGIKEQLTPEQALTLFAPKVAWKNNGKVDTPYESNPLAPGYTMPKPVQMTTTPSDDLRSKDAALGRGVTIRGQDIGKQTAEARLTFEKNKPVLAKAGPMSVTLQKELLESDDAVQTSNSVVSTLKSAMKLNDKAYSGYGAKTRATLVSNFGGSESADATVNIDNMMTGQGLDQMKSIFGAAPTEGERKILMDMQASADKTPVQRKSIMERAISAAERRGKYSEAKAKSIRGGTYLTEGVPAEKPTADPLDSLLDKYK